MSTLIPMITITRFKRLKASEIKEMKAVEVMSDGEHLFTAIIPHGDYIARENLRTGAEYLSNKANMTGGLEPSELYEYQKSQPPIITANDVIACLDNGGEA